MIVIDCCRSPRVFMFPLFLHSPSLGYSSNINCQSRQQGSMYGGSGCTPLGTPGPCQASRLPPHNPRLHAAPKHGHVRWLSNSHHKTLRVSSASVRLLFLTAGGERVGGGKWVKVVKKTTFFYISFYFI